MSQEEEYEIAAGGQGDTLGAFFVIPCYNSFSDTYSLFPFKNVKIKSAVRNANFPYFMTLQMMISMVHHPLLLTYNIISKGRC